MTFNFDDLCFKLQVLSCPACESYKAQIVFCLVAISICICIWTLLVFYYNYGVYFPDQWIHIVFPRYVTIQINPCYFICYIGERLVVSRLTYFMICIWVVP
jgi:hypothetical protein